MRPKTPIGAWLRFVVVAAAVLAALAITACGDDDSDTGTQTDQAATTTEETGAGGGGGAYGGGGGETAGGGAGGDEAAGGGSEIALAADPSGALAFDQDSLMASAGEITVDFTNDSEVGHNVVFQRDGEDVAGTDVITGSTATVSFEAEPGEYRFYCSVPGHADAGMEGTLTVE